MRYRLMATYQGVPYEAGIGPTDSDVVLFAACPPPEELGFEPATGHWRKQLRIQDVQALWESRPMGMFRDSHSACTSWMRSCLRQCPVAGSKPSSSGGGQAAKSTTSLS